MTIQARELNQTPSSLRCAASDSRSRRTACAAAAGSSRLSAWLWSRGYDGGGLAKGKPHIDLCEATFGVDRAQMLLIGDSLHDGEIAEREAIPFVGLAGTFSHERFTLRFPDVPVLRRFAELPSLFQAEAPAASARRCSARPPANVMSFIIMRSVRSDSVLIIGRKRVR